MRTREAAQRLAKKGRFGDTHLLHVSSDELAALASTGRMTRNPETGLPEAFGFGSITNAFRDVVDSVGHNVSDAVSSLGNHAGDLTTLVGNPLGNFAFTTPNSTVGQFAALASVPFLGPGAALPSFGGAGIAPGESGGMPIGLPGFGGGGDPLSALMSFGSGLFGLNRSKKQDELQRQMVERSDPFGPQRAQYAARLNSLYANPSQVENLPGYKAGLDAVERKMASQGYLGSGNMMLALHDYGGRMFDNEAARLAELAGAGMRPDVGGIAKINENATDTANKSLGSLGFGLKQLLSGGSGSGMNLSKLLALFSSGGGTAAAGSAAMDTAGMGDLIDLAAMA